MEEKILKLETKIEELEKKVFNENKEISMRISALELATALSDDRYNRILNEISSLKSEIQKLTEQPKKRWDTAVAAVITAVIGIAVGWFAGGKTV